MKKFTSLKIAVFLAAGFTQASAGVPADREIMGQLLQQQEWKIDLTKRYSRALQKEISISESHTRPFKDISYTDEIITNPEGEESLYSSTCLFLKSTGFAYGSGLASYVVVNNDKEDIYMRNFLPTSGMSRDVYVRGYYVENEELWHFPSGQLVGTIDGKNLYFGCLGLTSNDEVMLMDDGLFEIAEDFSFVSQIAYSIVGQEFLICYDEEGNVWGPVSELDMDKVTQIVANPPVDAAKVAYNISYDCCGDTFETDIYHMDNYCEMAIDGSNIFLHNFDFVMGGWVKGEKRANGDIFIPSGQLMGVNGNFIEYLFVKRGEAPYLSDTDGLWLYYDASNGSYTSDQDVYLAIGFNPIEIEVHHWNYVLTPAVETNGKPQTPQLYDFIALDGVYNIYQLVISDIDENGDHESGKHVCPCIS